MKNMFKSTIIILALLTFISMLSCGNIKPSENTEPFTVLSDCGYQVEWIDGTYYLVFEDEEYRQNVNASQEVPSLEFSSVKELKDAFIGGKLTENQMKTMSLFPKNKDGKIAIVDFSKLGDITLPETMELKYVYWKGSRYGMFFQSKVNESAIHGVAHVHNDNESYQLAFDEDHTSLSKYEDVIIKENKKENVTQYTFSTGTVKMKVLSYVLNINGTQLTIDEHYVLDVLDSAASHLIETSDTVPVDIFIFGSNSDYYFDIYLSGIEKCPTREWYSAFNMVAVD